MLQETYHPCCNFPSLSATISLMLTILSFLCFFYHRDIQALLVYLFVWFWGAHTLSMLHSQADSCLCLNNQHTHVNLEVVAGWIPWLVAVRSQGRRSFLCFISSNQVGKILTQEAPGLGYILHITTERRLKHSSLQLSSTMLYTLGNKLGIA